MKLNLYKCSAKDREWYTLAKGICEGAIPLHCAGGVWPFDVPPEKIEFFKEVEIDLEYFLESEIAAIKKQKRGSERKDERAGRVSASGVEVVFQMIELHRAPGTCCPEPSCDHGWHGQLIAQGLDEAGMECEECGQKCRDCERKKYDCAACPDLKCEYSANLIWFCNNDPRHASCNEMLRPGGKGCIRK